MGKAQEEHRQATQTWRQTVLTLIYAASVLKNLNFVVTCLIVIFASLIVFSIFLYEQVKEDEEKKLVVKGMKMCIIAFALMIVSWCLIPSNKAIDQIVAIASEAK